MKTTARKSCPSCSPDSTNLHDRATAADGSPVWRCRCCSNELPRRARQSTPAPVEDLDAELAEIFASLDASAAKLDAMLDARRS